MDNQLIPFAQNEIDISQLSLDISRLAFELEEEQKQNPKYVLLQAKKQELADKQKFNTEAKQLMLDNMLNSGLKSLKSSNGMTLTVKSTPKTKIVNEEVIPDEYKKAKIVVDLDKKKMLEDLKQGIEINGVELDYTNSLIISQ